MADDLWKTYAVYVCNFVLSSNYSASWKLAVWRITASPLLSEISFIIINLSQATWPIHRHSHTRTQYTIIQKKENKKTYMLFAHRLFAILCIRISWILSMGVGPPLGWVWVGLDWVSYLVDWVWFGSMRCIHGQLCESVTVLHTVGDKEFDVVWARNDTARLRYRPDDGSDNDHDDTGSWEDPHVPPDSAGDWLT